MRKRGVRSTGKIGKKVRTTHTRHRVVAKRDFSRDVVFENNPYPMWIYDAETLAFLAVNHAAVETYGYSRDEFLTMTLADIRPPEDVQRLVDFVKKPRPDFIHTEGWRHLLKDGHIIDVEISSHRMTIDGRPASLAVAVDITQRKKAERALRENEERFRSMFESVAVGLYRTTPDGRILAANPACMRILGLTTAEELASQNLETGNYPPHYSRAEFRKRLEQDGQIIGMEELWTRRDGTKVFVRESAKAIYGAEGQVLYYEGTIEDITQRVLAEQKVLRLNRTYAVLSNINQLIVRERDRLTLLKKVCEVAVEDGKFRMAWIGFVNNSTGAIEPLTFAGNEDGYLSLLGLTRNDTERGRGPTGTAIRENHAVVSNDIELDPGMAPWREQALARGFRSCAAFPLRDDGKAIGIVKFYSGEPDFFDVDEFRLLDELSMDISFALESLEVEAERKTAEELLQQLNAAVQASEEVVFMTDREGIFTFVNVAFERLYGYRADEIIGKATPRILKSVRQGPAFHEELWRSLTSKKIFKGEWINRSRDGRLLNIEATVNPILNEQGAILGFLAIQRDVTQDRNIEEQMRQAQKMESIGTLASGIAHDFNNILAIIVGHASLVERFRNDPARLAESVQNILSASKRGSALVRQVLTFARKNSIEIEPLLINDSVQEMERILRETFPKTITIECRLARQLPLVGADRTQVHQVLLNLCINARDAMDGTGTLVLTTSRVSGKELRARFVKAVRDEYVTVEVNDSGAGMDESTRQRIFEPFFTTKGIGKGTGLGLSVAFGIMENHGGFIDVRSDVGKGTTFSLYFPVVSYSENRPQSADAPNVDVAGGSETILIVEDEEMLRESVRLNLTAKGYTVLAAVDGHEAVTMYERHGDDIALVFCDFGLPKISGLEVLRRVKSINPNALFILVSGYVGPAERAEILKNGATDIILKPFSASDVLTKIRYTLDTQ